MFGQYLIKISTILMFFSFFYVFLFNCRSIRFLFYFGSFTFNLVKFLLILRKTGSI